MTTVPCAFSRARCAAVHVCCPSFVVLGSDCEPARSPRTHMTPRHVPAQPHVLQRHSHLDAYVWLQRKISQAQARKYTRQAARHVCACNRLPLLASALTPQIALTHARHCGSSFIFPFSSPAGSCTHTKQSTYRLLRPEYLPLGNFLGRWSLRGRRTGGGGGGERVRRLLGGDAGLGAGEGGTLGSSSMARS